MTDRIHTPYIFSREELQCIKDNFTSHIDWEKVIFNDIKKNIVDHLRPQQGNTCCYSHLTSKMLYTISTYPLP